jgi:hypothetical protein
MVYFDSGPPPFDAPNFFYCPANWYRDYFLDSRDFFEFLNSFFNGFADVNCDGVTNSQDVFDFLELFLIYCGF